MEAYKAEKLQNIYEKVKAEDDAEKMLGKSMGGRAPPKQPKNAAPPSRKKPPSKKRFRPVDELDDEAFDDDDNDGEPMGPDDPLYDGPGVAETSAQVVQVS